MTIGTPQDLGQNSSASTPPSLAITTTQSILAHDVIVVSHYCNAGGGTNISGVTDGSSNVYKQLVNQTAAAPTGEIWICWNAIALASGGTITASFAGSALRHGVNAMRIPGLLNAQAGVWDTHTGQAGTFETSTGTSSPNTPVNNYGALNEIILGFFLAGNAFGAFTPGTGFTALNTTAGTSAFIYTQYQIVSASAYTANIQNSASWANSVLHRGMSIGVIGACSC